MPFQVPEFDRDKTVTLFRVIFYVLLIVAAMWLVYELRSLIPPFLIAIVIALTMAPEIDRMERRGWKRWVAILVLYFLFIATFVALLLVFVPFVSKQLGDVARDLATHTGSLLPSSNASSATWSERISGTVARVLRLHNVPRILQAPVIEQARQVPSYLSGCLTALSADLVNWAGNLMWILVVPILAFYFLADYHKILGKMLVFVRPEKRLDMLRVLSDVASVFGNYMRGVVLMMLLDIAVIYVVLRIFHIEFAETIAALAGILYAIPYLGAIVSTTLIGLVALQGGTIGRAISVLVVMIVIHQFLFDQIIAPRIIGKQVGLHPLLAITAMLVGGTLMGIAGTLVAVPLAACAQVVIMHLYPRLSDDTVSELSERYAAESDEKAEIEKKANRAAISGKQSASRRRRIAQHLAEQIAEREQKQPADGPSTT